jgi:hypothetical protein
MNDGILPPLPRFSEPPKHYNPVSLAWAAFDNLPHWKHWPRPPMEHSCSCDISHDPTYKLCLYGRKYPIAYQVLEYLNPDRSRLPVVMDGRIHRLKDIRQSKHLSCAPIYLPEERNDHWSRWDHDVAFRKLIISNPRYEERIKCLTHVTRRYQCGWPRKHPFWYPYTDAFGVVKGGQHDPNVFIAMDLCPEISGTPCLDPFLNRKAQQASVRHNRPPPKYVVVNRLIKYWYHERIWEMDHVENVLAELEGLIHPFWRPTYEMHRRQRIRSLDPYFSFIENFCIRMAISTRNQQFRVLQAEVIQHHEGQRLLALAVRRYREQESLRLLAEARQLSSGAEPLADLIDPDCQEPIWKNYTIYQELPRRGLAPAWLDRHEQLQARMMAWESEKSAFHYIKKILKRVTKEEGHPAIEALVDSLRDSPEACGPLSDARLL